MRLLVIGLDGGDERIVRGLPMPFLRDRLRAGRTLDVREDLWARGWTKILSGLPGTATGAFYNRPALDGSPTFTQSFGTAGYRGLARPPLWAALNGAGRRVGFLNPPTTMPAPAVDGWFVAGAGGGHSPSGPPPPVATQPPELAERFAAADCPWELRFGASGITDVDVLFERLAHTVTTRARLFAELAGDVDVGFLVQKELVTVQNLAMAAVEPLLGGAEPTGRLQHHIVEFYAAVDASLAHAVERCDPERVVIVSDHGSTVRRGSLNPNALLRDGGLQEQSARGRLVPIAKRLAGVVPVGLRRRVLGRVPGLGALVNERQATAWDDTEAFAARYVPGIYVNDQRFGGPVPDTRRAAVVAEVIDRLAEVAPELGPRPYRSEHAGAATADLLPDVWLDVPEGWFVEDHGSARAFEHHATVGPLAEVTRDLHTGVKRDRPLVWIDDAVANVIDEPVTRDLTVAYDVIVAAATR